MTPRQRAYDLAEKIKALLPLAAQLPQVQTLLAVALTEAEHLARTESEPPRKP